MNSKIRLGVSLYCFTNEYYTYKYTLEDCLAKVAELGSDGFEIVAPQMIAGHPWPSDAFIDSFLQLCEKHKVKPVSFGSYVDKGMRSDRELNQEEIFDSALNDLRYAKKFGCPIMRSQEMLSPQVFERIIPYAEDYGVKVGMEVHFPRVFESPLMQEYYHVIVKSGSPYVCLIPDFGSYQERPHKQLIEDALELGASGHIVQYLTDAFKNGETNEQIAGNVKKMGGTDTDMELLIGCFALGLKAADLKGLKKMMPYVPYMHSKFFYIDENDFDSSIPYDKILSIVKESGFEGYIMSEYAGHHHGPNDIMEQLRRHLRMEKKYLGLS
ncbi:MAG: sugar phosphate isomerase/epimerase [Treponema sp.]|jgi:sugar phosphate isomerase/epimerase|nr:sugar phosphate isomerase/epimerase [Treponema sp.]